MYKGRHCIESDYYLLVKETDKILLLLKDEVEVLSELLKYIEFIADFDEQIAAKICFYLDKDNIDRRKMVDIIKSNFEELKQNVIVDINEHK